VSRPSIAASLAGFPCPAEVGLGERGGVVDAARAMATNLPAALQFPTAQQRVRRCTPFRPASAPPGQGFHTASKCSHGTGIFPYEDHVRPACRAPLHLGGAGAMDLRLNHACPVAAPRGAQGDQRLCTVWWRAHAAAIR